MTVRPVAASILAACLALFIALADAAHARMTEGLGYPPGTERRAAADFLTASLPESDRAMLPEASLRENVDYALLAREETPWARDVPFDIFLHYVLPHRLVNEPFKPWRKGFHDQLAPLVRDCRTAWEAAVRVNLWCAARVEYQPSASWLTAPADMFAVGFGRCEDLAVLFAAAARSVGIPVRGCWVPGWRRENDNHVWVEVWDRGRWLPLEAASTVVDPNDNWFLKPARTAPAVYSPAYGEFKAADTPIYRRGRGFTTLNLLGRYADTREFAVACLGRGGQRAPGLPVCLWTYNSGGPWIVARALTDASGAARFLLGPGSYIASAGDGVDATAALAEEGASTRLDLRRALPKAWSWTLRHPAQDSPNRFDPPDASVRAELAAMAERATRARKRRKEDVLLRLDALSKVHPDTPRAVVDAFAKPWPSALRLFHEYLALAPAKRQLIEPLLTGMRAKDLALLPLDALADFAASRKRAAEALHWRRLPPHWIEDVASPRALRETLSLPGKELDRLAAALRGPSARESVKNVADYMASAGRRRHRTTLFDAFLPVGTVCGPAAGLSEREATALCTALLRALGIPAHPSVLDETAMYWDGEQYRPVATLATGIDCPPAAEIQPPPKGRLLLFSGQGDFIALPDTYGERVPCLRRGELLRVKTQRLDGTRIRGTFERSAGRERQSP
ncbi:transglutaminase domain-containing protein [Pseudodesulfovibrio sp.]|uniref:transglutaminase domain-containing protein n=1 Tax=Pseudodesulfovibrio sp. TaxID=2035812 RepID=UPI002628AFF7|nr:transglutaminase domain-containing protein [Pseudodesulfovibrio sp.]MDD3313310.1 transglutaminase domain-containing protein [Pseudodesulfovibrio sp.]